MTQETWHQARLIPSSGISGAEEQERRATSALLAVLGAVKEFARAPLGPVGSPSGTVETYVEVPFMLGEKRVYPDGLIRVTRGGRSWTALVEVQTGRNELATEQLENYPTWRASKVSMRSPRSARRFPPWPASTGRRWTPQLDLGTLTVMSVTGGGNPLCTANNTNYRVDTPTARQFLGQFIALP